MTNERDPRVDPKPGDVVRHPGAFLSFTVKRVDEDGHIAGSFQGGMTGSLCLLPYWRRTFAANAEVIHAAE